MSDKFSLKDYLFNKQKIEKIADEIKKVYDKFDTKNFINKTVEKFPELELKQRITWIAEKLKEYLPADYQKATKILLQSLPPPNDATKTDDDFGDFIYAPYNEFVAKYGCTKEDLQFSLNALKEITRRFSAEDAIRYFINAFPKETLVELQKWSNDSHYHVRRLTTEGTRPKLPWATKINISIEAPLPILDNLFWDKTRFVTRSVANHINDISKINPELALATLKKWKESGKQNEKEMEYIITHSLRTLIKLGYKNAIEFLDISSDPKVTLIDFNIKNNYVKIGESLEFGFTLKADKDEQLIIDYTLYFPNKAGKGFNKKVFKIKQISMKKDETITITKRHPMRANMTTRKLIPGKHEVEIQVNGKKLTRSSFELVD